MKYNIIAWTEKHGSHTIESFDTPEQAINHFLSLTNPQSYDPYFEDLKAAGGYLRIENSDGSEVSIKDPGCLYINIR